MQRWHQPGIKRPGKGPKIKTRNNNMACQEKALEIPQFHMVQEYPK